MYASHGGDYEECYLLEYNALQSGRSPPRFRMNVGGQDGVISQQIVLLISQSVSQDVDNGYIRYLCIQNRGSRSLKITYFV
jgi:hypothetical protein